MASKLALIIGCGVYDDARLSCLSKPAVDASAFAQVLGDPEIAAFDEVSTIIDGTSTDVRRAIARFFDKKIRDDTLLLYFSGHGLRDDRGQLFLAARDTEQDLLSASAVSASFITEEMDRCRSRRQVLILDCCYSGAFEGAKAGSSSVGAAKVFEGNGFGRVVLTATNSTQFAWETDEDGSSAQSLFTQYIIRGLKTGEADVNGDGKITVDELYDYVYEKILNEAPRQTPGKSSSKQEGDIVLVHYPGAKPIQLPYEIHRLLKSDSEHSREAGLQALSHFFEGSIPVLAEAARKELNTALSDGSLRVSRTAAKILGIKTNEPTSASLRVNSASLSPQDEPLPQASKTASNPPDWRQRDPAKPAGTPSEIATEFFSSFAEPGPALPQKRWPIWGVAIASTLALSVLWLLLRSNPVAQQTTNSAAAAVLQPTVPTPTKPPRISEFSTDRDPPLLVGNGVSQPEKLYSPPPRYTEAAKKAHVKGTTIVEAIIDKNGTVTSVKALKGPRSDLKAAAIDAVRQWKFKPARLRGKTVTVRYSFKVTFIDPPELTPEGKFKNPWER